MRSDLHPIYKDLYERYRQAHAGEESSGRLLSEIAGAIDRAAADLQLGERFRPDARLFLLINMHQMVLLPLTHARAIPPELHHRLNDDVHAVLSSASQGRTGEIS